MGAGTGWFHANYWHTNYWHANYWAPTGSVGGDYWHNNYWHQNYWHSNYWVKVGDIGDVLVTDDANLFLNAFVPAVETGPVVMATTAVLPLAAFSTDANNDFTVNATLATLPLVSFDLGVGTSGYILGDIPLTFSPDSEITITYGMAPGAPSVGLGTFHPTTSTPDGLDVGVGTPTALEVTEFNVNATNDVDVQPVPQSLTLTAFDSPAAGIGTLIRVPTVPLTFSAPTHTISGVPIANIRVTAVIELPFGTPAQNIFGRPGLFIPPPTFGLPDNATDNANADDYPSQYEICERTGFRVKKGELVKEWTGSMVRKESFERRNAQDFVRGVGDEQEGSPRPEQMDRFTDEVYPGGVSADDL